MGACEVARSNVSGVRGMSMLDLPFDMLEVPATGVVSARVKQLKIGSRELHFPPQQIVRERTGLGCRYRNRGQHYHAQNRGMRQE